MLKIYASILLNSAKTKPKDKKVHPVYKGNFHEKDYERIIAVIFVQPQYIKTMTSVSKSLLLKQWQTLHICHENYEQYALIIKLLAIACTALAISLSLSLLLSLFLLSIVWLQEAIWKTYQGRIADAIIVVEDKMTCIDAEDIDKPGQPYLLYKQWQLNRNTSKQLIKEYLGNSIKPTVIYPYLPLVLILLIF